jgi:hypothetical protein
MEKKEREQLKERLLKMVVNEPRLESIPPMTMAEVMVNSMSKPNLEPLLDFISQELDRAREEGRREVLEDMRKMWDNDNLGDAPKYGSAGAGLMKRWIRDDINKRLSKLTTK